MNFCGWFPVRLILSSSCQIFGKDNDLGQNIVQDVMRLHTPEPGQVQLIIGKDRFEQPISVCRDTPWCVSKKIRVIVACGKQVVEQAAVCLIKVLGMTRDGSLEKTFAQVEDRQLRGMVVLRKDAQVMHELKGEADVKSGNALFGFIEVEARLP
jgi:hypothetical protein